MRFRWTNTPGRWGTAAVLGSLVAVVLAACRAEPAPVGGATPAEATATPLASPVPVVTPGLDGNPPVSASERGMAELLRTRFPGLDPSIKSIELTELRDGGPGKDGIPAIDEPVFVSQDEGDGYLDDQEPVISLAVGGEARAYPIQILTWHEIANDTVGGTPVAVTFCPLCNTAIIFDRRVDGGERTFGVSGLLRRSDLIMYDRTNQSLWQQITGEAIVGVDTGARLEFLPSQIVSWDDFKRTYPGALVLSRETGHDRPYGTNPYLGYDRIGSSTLFPVPEFADERLDAKERVLTVELGGETVAFPFSALSEHVVLEAEVGGEPVVAFWQPGALSPLDGEFIVGGRNVGAAGAFSPLLDGERLRFAARGEEIVDTGTGSVWSVLGRAVSGPLEGEALEPVVSANHFLFSWVVFKPETRVVRE